jgi:hypothetical protein
VAEDRFVEVRRALSRGDVLIAYDRASELVEQDPTDLDARYLAALASARAGAAERAAESLAQLQRLLAHGDTLPARLLEDTEALGARLAKDRAMAASGTARVLLARQAADLYEAAAESFGGYYSCINAATLRMIAGDGLRARTLAARAKCLAELGAPGEPDDAYWRQATVAEADLLVGDVAGTAQALERAAREQPDLGARAATRRQLHLLCDVTGTDHGVMELLAMPAVLHYCGHRLDDGLGPARLPAEIEPRVRGEVAAYLDRAPIGSAFGSLACGADIVIAEALLDRKVDLHAVLPFSPEEFDRTSVAPAGPEWSRRFGSCLERATSVTITCDSAYLGDTSLFGYAARIAMGRALNRANVLDADVRQLAVWDGCRRRGPGGTADSVELWRGLGKPTHVIPTVARPLEVEGRSAQSAPAGLRSVRAVLFADFRGFSQLRDEQFPAFVDHVLGVLAGVLRCSGTQAAWQNSWGDAIQVIFNDVVTAAQCTLEFQEALARVDVGALGLPPHLALRVGAHVGPVMQRMNPLTGASSYWGRELTRTARIEPRTPEGEVYVTDAFAALLALEGNVGLATEYVGRIETAKQFETIPMYRLRRA